LIAAPFTIPGVTVLRLGRFLAGSRRLGILRVLGVILAFCGWLFAAALLSSALRLWGSFIVAGSIAGSGLIVVAHAGFLIPGLISRRLLLLWYVATLRFTTRPVRRSRLTA
jgi:hypothetical protein